MSQVLERDHGGKVMIPNAVERNAPQGQIVQLSATRLALIATAMTVLWTETSALIPMIGFALPNIAKDLQISDASVQWVAPSCMLPWGCLQLVAGRLLDIHGRRWGLLVGTAILGIFTGLAAFMPNLVGLNICVGFVGLGGAICLPASSGILGTLFPVGRSRSMAFVAVTIGGSAGASTGPLLMGIFIESVRWTWRGPFLLIGILFIFPLCVAYFAVTADRPLVKQGAMDWTGAMTMGISLFLFLLTFTLSETSSKGWSTPYLPALLVTSAIFFILFIWRQMWLNRLANAARTPPLIPRQLVSWSRNRNVVVIYIASAILWASCDSIIIFIAYLYSDVLHLSAVQSGLRLGASIVSGIVASTIVALLITRMSIRLFLFLACLITAPAGCLFATRHTDWAFWKADLWALSVMWFGLDALIAAGGIIISQDTLPEHQSTAQALFQTTWRLGYAIGLAISTLIRTNVQKASAERFMIAALDRGENKLQKIEMDQAVHDGLRAAFWSCGGYALTASIVILVGMKGWSTLCKEEAEPSRVDQISRRGRPDTSAPLEDEATENV